MNLLVDLVPATVEEEHPFAQYLRAIGRGKKGARNLTEEEAFDAMSMVLNGQVRDEQIGALLLLLRVKEESAEELAGFTRAVRTHQAHPSHDLGVEVDWPTYAGKKRQLPWYLAAALALADQGIKVLMHGASGHTAERVYTDQLFEVLGLPIAQNWDEVARDLEQHRISYLPVGCFSPGLDRLFALRGVLGLRSVAHTFARLVNPAKAPVSLQSIFHPAYLPNHQRAAELLGDARYAVFKGESGEIERRPEADVQVLSVIDGHSHEQLWPRLLDSKLEAPEALRFADWREHWRGTLQVPGADERIIGTLAIVLQLRQPDLSQAQALDDARRLWQARNRSRL